MVFHYLAHPFNIFSLTLTFSLRPNTIISVLNLVSELNLICHGFLKHKSIYFIFYHLKIQSNSTALTIRSGNHRSFLQFVPTDLKVFLINRTKFCPHRFLIQEAENRTDESQENPPFTAW